MALQAPQSFGTRQSFLPRHCKRQIWEPRSIPKDVTQRHELCGLPLALLQWACVRQTLARMQWMSEQTLSQSTWEFPKSLEQHSVGAASASTIIKPFSQIKTNPTIWNCTKLSPCKSRTYTINYKVPSLKKSMWSPPLKLKYPEF